MVGKGSNKRGVNGKIYKGKRRIITAFDDTTFDEIRSMAIAANCSFAEQVRTLVEWGLESAKETSRGAI